MAMNLPITKCKQTAHSNSCIEHETSFRLRQMNASKTPTLTRRQQLRRQRERRQPTRQ